MFAGELYQAWNAWTYSASCWLDRVVAPAQFLHSEHKRFFPAISQFCVNIHQLKTSTCDNTKKGSLQNARGH